VQYSDDYDSIGLNGVKNSERKSMQQRPTGRPVNYRVGKRTVGYGDKRRLRLLKKLESEATALLLVPGRGVGEILLRLGPEADFDSLSRRRISARASEAWRPGLLSTS
jgi:hypothetical protein